MPRDYRHYPAWLHRELVNWSRWCWSGGWPHPLPPDHCASLEGEYIAPPYFEDEAPPPKPAPINPETARVVDGVWYRMPDGPRLVLRDEYPMYGQSGRAEFGKVGAARRLKMSLKLYEDNLVVAIGRVWTALEDRQ